MGAFGARTNATTPGTVPLSNPPAAIVTHVDPTVDLPDEGSSRTDWLGSPVPDELGSAIANRRLQLLRRGRCETGWPGRSSRRLGQIRGSVPDGAWVRSGPSQDSVIKGSQSGRSAVDKDSLGSQGWSGGRVPTRVRRRPRSPRRPLGDESSSRELSACLSPYARMNGRQTFESCLVVGVNTLVGTSIYDHQSSRSGLCRTPTPLGSSAGPSSPSAWPMLSQILEIRAATEAGSPKRWAAHSHPVGS